MNDLKLVFSPLGTGREQGVNHAGINNFSDDYHLRVVREGIQNSLDASVSDQITVCFSRSEIDRCQIPEIEALQKVFDSAADYWDGKNAETRTFSTVGAKIARENMITCLEMADYGTRGLEREKGWYGLVLAGGVSVQQDETAGGSYGLGKFAPFGSSRLRTVLYSTRSEKGWTAFQGACEFATHLDENGVKNQHTGYIGIPDGDEVRPLEDFTKIPDMFRREKTGTSLYVLGYRDTTDRWEENLILPIVEHFWPAIHDQKLEVKVGKSIVNFKTLPEFLEKFSATVDGFKSHFYYSAVNGTEMRKALKGLGECRLFLIPGDSNLPKKVCMTRKTGMVIDNWDRFKSYRPFAGWFTCISNTGNEVLRKLEPPAHDQWAPKNKGEDGSAVLKEIRAWINECLSEINPKDDDNDADIPELAKYLPDDEELDDTDLRSTSSETAESFVFKPPTEPLQITPVKSSNSSLGTSQIEEGSADGSEGGEGEGSGKIDPNEKPNEGGGGESDQKGGGDTGENKKRKVSRKIRARAIRMAESCYQLTLRPESKPVSGTVELRAVGEDNKAVKLTVISAKDPVTREEIDLSHVSIESGESLKLNVIIAETENVALEVVCHDN